MTEPELNRLASLLDEAAKIAEQLPQFTISLSKLAIVTGGSSKEDDSSSSSASPTLPTREVPIKDTLEYLRKAAVNRKLQQLAAEKPKLDPTSPGRNTPSMGRISRFRASTISASSPPPFVRASREKIDIDSPLEKVIRILKKFKAKLIDENDLSDLDYMMKVVTSNELYRPNLDIFQENNVQMDSETKEWLERDYLLKGSQNRGPGPLSHARSIGNLLIKRTSERFIAMNNGTDETEEIRGLLRNVDSWNFEIFNFAEATKGRPLYYMGYTIFKRLEMISRWGIDDKCLRSFLTEIESGYVSENPYHNSIHAADVTHATYYFLLSGLSEQIGELEVLGLIVAAIIHDFQHPGYTNAFQVKTESEHALLYNDRSVLENFHLASAFALIRKKENNIFSGLTKDERAEIRELIINLVLATDMSVHFDKVSQFKTKLATGIDMSKKEDRLLVLQMAIKCADISAQAKSLDTSLRWSQNVAEEFFRQGDKEKELQLPISAFMDRQTSSPAKSQLGFIDFIVTPTWEAWISHLDKLTPCREYISKNRSFWEKQEITVKNLVPQ